MFNRPRYSQPYRGQPRPKYPRPRKQIRNLRLEKLEGTKTIISIFLTLSVIVIVLVTLSQNFNPKLIGILFLSVLIVGGIISLAVADGLRSINKFRKGYDFDISSSEVIKENNDNQEEDKID